MKKVKFRGAWITLMLIAVVIAGACAGIRGGDRETQEMLEAVHAADDAFNSNEVENYAAHLTEDFIHDNVSGEPVGKDVFCERVGGFMKAFPGITNYQKALLPAGKYVVFDECSFDIPIPDTDTVITIFHMDIVEMEGSKLKVKTTFGDGADLDVVLGTMQPPVPLPEDVESQVLPGPEAPGMKPAAAQEEFQRRWNVHDVDGLARMIRNDAEILVSPLLAPVGRDAYAGWQAEYFRAFPDIRMETERLISGDDWAISEVRVSGTHEGVYLGHPGTGKSLDLRAGWLARYDENGMVTSLKLYIDSMVVMNQLGLEPVMISKR